MIANLSFIAVCPWNETPRDVEDDQLLAAIQKHIEDLERRNAEVA